MTCYLFDVDNTLTPPREKMDSAFTFFFLNWMESRSVYFVGGSDYKKIFQQIPASIINRCDGVFCSMANELLCGEEHIYKNEWLLPDELEEDLMKIVEDSAYGFKKGRHIEQRVGMVNFSIAGRNSNCSNRQKYNQWDSLCNEREFVVEFIEKKYPEIEAKIGGQISIDIFPKGNDKSQASKWIRQNVSDDIVFIGDQCDPTGNDFAIYREVLLRGGNAHKVNSFNETREILEKEYQNEKDRHGNKFYRATFGASGRGR
mgnify:CR=1 FL=1